MKCRVQFWADVPVGLISPAPCGGSTNVVIRFKNDTPTGPGVFKDQQPTIDGYAAPLEGNEGDGSFLHVPRPPTARYARVGDLLELSVRNETDAVHPFHLHGFSFQPLRVLDNSSGNTNYTYDYNEFVDTIDVYNGQTLVFRVKLEDRERICDGSPSFPPGPVLKPCSSAAAGGAIGRWVFHCHIFSHAGLGMISELTVLGDAKATRWVQQPDATPAGLDVLATRGAGSQTVADDFQWLGNGPITDITIWGSWLSDVADPNVTFELKFWTDVPASPGRPSRPGWQAWRQLFPVGSYTHILEAVGYEGFYDPSQTNLIGADTQIRRYDFVIPEGQAFCPSFSSTNWLSVTAYATNAAFGWKTCLIGDRWNDDATWSPTLIGPHWSELRYPPGHSYAGLSMDMSFLLRCPDGVAAPPPPAPAPLVLSVTATDGGISISWTGAGILQYADEVTGPWINIEGATSPYLAPMDASRRFYRVLIP